MLPKLEKFLFYLFLFLIPFQIRATIIWQGSEWNSIFLYLTDLLLIGFLFFGFINKRISFKKTDILLFLFLLIAGISIFASSNLGVSIYRFVKLLEFAFLYIYVRNPEVRLPQSGGFQPRILEERDYGARSIKGICKALIASGVFQAILAIAQFYKQSSLGIRFIEAGKYLPGAPGVATFISNDAKILRAYGSFPHPNVLAGFLLLAIFCFYYLWIFNAIKGRFRYMLHVMCYGLMVFALFVSFSRTTIFVFLIISFVFLLIRFFQMRQLYHTEERLLAGKRLMILALFFIVFSALSSTALLPYMKTRFLTISLKEEAIDLRFFYNKIALAIIKDKPILGIGVGNFVNYSQNYPAFLRAANAMLSGGGQGNIEIPSWLYQPAHNIYLLIASEIGILGLLVFLLFIAKKLLPEVGRIFKTSTEINSFLFLVSCFLIIGLLDHYFWTLQSGSLMFWFGLALIGPHSLTDKAQPSGG
jgi:O-antigen ligase